MFHSLQCYIQRKNPSIDPAKLSHQKAFAENSHFKWVFFPRGVSLQLHLFPLLLRTVSLSASLCNQPDHFVTVRTISLAGILVYGLDIEGPSPGPISPYFGHCSTVLRQPFFTTPSTANVVTLDIRNVSAYLVKKSLEKIKL